MSLQTPTDGALKTVLFTSPSPSLYNGITRRREGKRRRGDEQLSPVRSRPGAKASPRASPGQTKWGGQYGWGLGIQTKAYQYAPQRLNPLAETPSGKSGIDVSTPATPLASPEIFCD